MRIDLRRTLLAASVLLVLCGGARAQSSFVNWETPHVHPLDLTPDLATLLAVNTPDARLEVFTVSGALPVKLEASNFAAEHT